MQTNSCNQKMLYVSVIDEIHWSSKKIGAEKESKTQCFQLSKTWWLLLWGYLFIQLFIYHWCWGTGDEASPQGPALNVKPQVKYLILIQICFLMLILKTPPKVTLIISNKSQGTFAFSPTNRLCKTLQLGSIAVASSFLFYTWKLFKNIILFLFVMSLSVIWYSIYYIKGV